MKKLLTALAIVLFAISAEALDAPAISIDSHNECFDVNECTGLTWDIPVRVWIPSGENLQVLVLAMEYNAVGLELYDVVPGPHIGTGSIQVENWTNPLGYPTYCTSVTNRATVVVVWQINNGVTGNAKHILTLKARTPPCNPEFGAFGVKISCTPPTESGPFEMLTEDVASPHDQHLYQYGTSGFSIQNGCQRVADSFCSWPGDCESGSWEQCGHCPFTFDPPKAGPETAVQPVTWTRIRSLYRD